MQLAYIISIHCLRMREFIEKRTISDTLLNMDSAKGLRLNMLFWTLPMLSNLTIKGFSMWYCLELKKAFDTVDQWLNRHEKQKATLNFTKKKTEISRMRQTL